MRSGGAVDTSGGRRWRERALQSRSGTMMVLAATAILVLGAVYLVDHGNGGTGLTSVNLTGAASGSPPVIGRPAQDFTATTVDGTRISLSQYRGHPVWLTFGASWCAECRAEAPDIQGAYLKFRAAGGIVVQVFISEDAGSVRGYAARVGLTYVKIADPDTRIASAYRVLGIPQHFFIDRSGVLRATKTGSLSRAQMDATLAGITR